MFIAALFIIDPNYKHSLYSSADEWLNRLWFIDAMEYYATRKRQMAT